MEDLQTPRVLRALNALFVAWVVLGLVPALITRTHLAATIALLIVSGAVLYGFRQHIGDGSRTARIALTAWALVQMVGLTLTAIAWLQAPLLLAYCFAGVMVRSAVIAIVNVPPISKIPRRRAVAQPPSADGAHEHDWHPHEIFNDWVRCSTCRSMHVSPGTIAAVNSARP